MSKIAVLLGYTIEAVYRFDIFNKYTCRTRYNLSLSERKPVLHLTATLAAKSSFQTIIFGHMSFFATNTSFSRFWEHIELK